MCGGFLRMTLPFGKNIDMCNAFQYNTRYGQEELTKTKAWCNDLDEIALWKKYGLKIYRPTYTSKGVRMNLEFREDRV
jgi:hypothetical protein